MRKDIDLIMKERNLDFIIIYGEAYNNPNMEYFVGSRSISGLYFIKPQYGEPLLISGSMERDEAAKAGYLLKDYNYFNYAEIYKEEPDILKARVKFLHKVCDEMNIHGRVAFYGKMDINQHVAALEKLADERKLELVWEIATTAIDLARVTKSHEETAAIKAVGKKSFVVYRLVREMLINTNIKNNKLIHENQELTIGDVKSFIRLKLAKLDLLEESDTIFSMGKESAVPHNYGTDNIVLEAGQTIIMDMFPRGKKEGYFFDMTRTFCVGYIPDAIGRMYEDLKMVHLQMLNSFEVGVLAKDYQLKTCELFEQLGHPTVKSEPSTIKGFVHALGHGLGLQVHEHPFFGTSPSNLDKIEIGSVFTVEPGLYYPEQGMGARIEDVVYMDDNGKPVNMTDFPIDLLVENKG
jgi:Xaa-Pro aminopeptidase